MKTCWVLLSVALLSCKTEEAPAENKDAATASASASAKPAPEKQAEPKKPSCAEGEYSHPDPAFCIKLPEGFAPDPATPQYNNQVFREKKFNEAFSVNWYPIPDSWEAEIKRKKEGMAAYSDVVEEGDLGAPKTFLAITKEKGKADSKPTINAMISAPIADPSKGKELKIWCQATVTNEMSLWDGFVAACKTLHLPK